MNHHSNSDESGALLGEVRSALGRNTKGDQPSVTVSVDGTSHQVAVEYTREAFFARINADNQILRSIPQWDVESASVDAATYTVMLSYTHTSDGAPNAGVQVSSPVAGRKSRKHP